MRQHYDNVMSQGNRLGLSGACIAFLGLIFAAPAAAENEPKLPRFGDYEHLGVATCSGSTCHGSGREVADSNVLQTEFLIWHRKDAHSRAYDVLRSERSQRMARRLGLGKATEADTCLDCHADNVPPDRRGKRFQLSDGVGCEACHGGGEEWIRSHASGEVSHAENIEQGLYPTDRPVDRTRLCMSCHYSNPASKMSHRLMAAGHPSLLFEADTFSLIRPRHHEVDADYRRRKMAASAADTWAIGQAVAARIKLEHVRDDLERDDLFPELYYFDCRSCHHELGDDSWVARPVVDMAPGSVRFEDATFRMLGYVLAELEPELGQQWRARLKALHRAQASGFGAVREAAGRLHAMAAKAEERLAGTRLDTAAVRAIAGRIVAAGAASGYANRTWSDQASMALGALIDNLASRDGLEEEQLEQARQQLDRLFDALASPYGHDAERVRGILQGLSPVF